MSSLLKTSKISGKEPRRTIKLWARELGVRLS
jgi:hypothetical protein